LTRLDKLQAFLATDPNDSFTRYAIGLEYGKTNNFAAAVKSLEDLRRDDPGYIPTYYMLAGYYRELGENKAAEVIYRDGILKARAANDLHAASELQAALDELDTE